MSDDQQNEEVTEGTKESKESKEDITKTSDSSDSSKKVSKKLDDLISQVEKLSVLELSELVHALEDKFGVSASAAVAVAAGPAAGAESGESADEEQTTFNVILTESGANKISVIKAVRELVPTLGLKEAKDLVDAPPKPILEGVNKENAQEAKQKLETAGAKVELK
jgi:large subunit ribosomal protein L7/L12